ncbi:[FeFe] hydrogenase H-cluster radical SAM maturase HydE [Ruminococcus sp.]|uniref:[FeFe] hydrogenase H-cluster radical SAM maturase HydE n=1 Tax=Ruminococcus sp. TaxID=41978 RepID=UPI0025EFA853|nr:[FeFe] hydrogenase H-cluster radical SAM maturase HydE [Ruminococcus sp.]MBQ8967716.1 [FeFe] hydrogenase H-cluster radical SAM maturase HydE [Ruminococcus sp.]
MSRVTELIDKLNEQKHLDKAEWVEVLENFTDEDREYAAGIARSISLGIYGNKIFIRGIVEFSNVCKNDCLYCGIRRSNTNVSRYRLTDDEIADCCDEGYELGFRTFVLQSGEDKSYSTERLCGIVRRIKAAHPDCAVTLSIGELEYEDYKALREAGADRYLLRHETADKAHYEKLHPAEMSWQHRMDCLKALKDLGYQTGAGIMVGSPYQTVGCIAEDMIFFESFKPEMIGIGPFLPHKDTPFRDEPKGSYELTLFLLSLCRILLPDVLLPATTALGTIAPLGREEGVKAGANVIMPNLSPTAVRKKYMLYDNKICTGDESAQCRGCLEARMKSIGYEVAVTRGDHI